MEKADSDSIAESRSSNMEKDASDPPRADSDPTTVSSDLSKAVDIDPTSTDKDTTVAPNPKNSSEEGSGAGLMKILRCIVDNQKYPITLKTFHKVFSKFGKIKKIVMFRKNNQLQALIEFHDSATAHKALIALDNKNIYDGCCYMRIDYSNISETLKVQYNNEKTWDFTKPHLPSSGPAEGGEERTQDTSQQSFTGGSYRGGGGARGKGEAGGPGQSQHNARGGGYGGGALRGNGMGNMGGQVTYSGRGMRTMGRIRGYEARRNHPYERGNMRPRGMGNTGYERGNMRPRGNIGYERGNIRPRGIENMGYNERGHMGTMNTPRRNMGEAHRGVRGRGMSMGHMDHGDRGSWRGPGRGQYMD